MKYKIAIMQILVTPFLFGSQRLEAFCSLLAILQVENIYIDIEFLRFILVSFFRLSPELEIHFFCLFPIV